MCRLQILSCPSCFSHRPVPLLMGGEVESSHDVVQDVECRQFYCRWHSLVHTFDLPSCVVHGQNVEGTGCGEWRCSIDQCRVQSVWRHCATCRLVSLHALPLRRLVRKVVSPWRDVIYHCHFQL